MREGEGRRGGERREEGEGREGGGRERERREGERGEREREEGGREGGREEGERGGEEGERELTLVVLPSNMETSSFITNSHTIQNTPPPCTNKHT